MLTELFKKYFIICLLVLFGLNAQVAASDPKRLSNFVENNVMHVVLHEIAHALIKEFELPILGNEENMADGFATYYITQNMHDDAAQIITARAKSWIYEDSQVKPENYDMKGEHELDIRRAYNVMCALYGADPAQWESDVEWVGFSERDLNDCSDSTPHQTQSWQKILKLYLLGLKKSTNVELIFGEGPYKQVMENSGLMQHIEKIMQRFDWPQAVVLHFDHCDSGAFWNRETRVIMLCDDLIERFVEYEKYIKVQ